MLSNYQTMDINILLSIVNMKLRNENKSFEIFCNSYQVEASNLLQRFQKNGFIYNAQQNQFKRAD